MRKLNVLITGANRGLGLEIAKKLAPNALIYATGRSEVGLREAFSREHIALEGAFELNLMEPDEAKIKSIFEALPALDAVIHCASPYLTKQFMETSTEEMRQYTNCILSDQLFAQAAMGHLSKHPEKQSTLMVSGAVIGLPHIHSRGVMGLLKDQQRQLWGVLNHESLDHVHVKHLNLGTFRDVVNEPHKEISTASVTDIVQQIVNNPGRFPHNLNLVSDENERQYEVIAYGKEEVGAADAAASKSPSMFAFGHNT